MSRKSSFWKSLGGKSRKSRHGWQKRSYARPVMSVERLEDRHMLSANPVLSLMQNQFFGQDPQEGVNIERGLPFHATFTDVVDQVDIDNESVQTWVATIDWGDGSPIDRSDVPALNGTHPDKSLVAISPTTHTPFLANRAAGDLITGQIEGFHNYATVGDFTVTVTLTDSNGGDAGTQSTPVKVYAYDRDDHGNGGAQIGFDDIFEQTPYSLTLDGSASRNHNITSWTISWGDSVETFDGNPSSVTHTYNDDDDFRDPYFGDSPYVPIIAAVTGENGTFVVSRTITIHDVEPVVTAHAGSNDLIANESAIVDINEGETFSITNMSYSGDAAEPIQAWLIVWGDETPDVTPQDLVHPGDITSASHDYAPNGNATYNVFFAPVDSDGSSPGTFVVEVHVHNLPPIADAGGPYTVDEGGSITLNGLGSSDAPGTRPLASYDWDLDGDGEFDDATGPTPVFDAAGIDGTANYTIRLRVTDQDGDTAISTTTLTVSNAAPIADFAGTSVVEGSSSATVAFSNPFDPSSDDTAAGFQYAFDFDNDGTFEIGPGSTDNAIVPASYLTDGGPANNIRGRIIDKDGGYTDYIVNIANVAPTLTISGAASVSEGSSYTLSLSSFDPGPDTITSWTINWGDATPAQIVSGNPSSVSHTYADGDNNYTISASATDEDGTFDAAGTVAVAASNVAPTLSLSGAAAVAESSSYTLNLSSFDPGADTIISWTINWGDATPAQTVSGNPASISHTYADGNNNYTISATATDEDGEFAAGNTVSVTVTNVDPTASFSGGGTVNEGSAAGTVAFSGQLDPSEADTSAGFHYAYDFNNDGTFDVGDGSYGGSVTAASQPVPASFLVDGDATYNIKGRIIDKDGGFTDYTAAIIVLNVAPTLTISGGASVNEGSSYTLNLSSFDPGADTINHWTINWGDGSQTVSGNPSSVSHIYADGSASYTISATATDEDGTYSAGNTVGVTVNNVIPTLTISGAASVSEGSSYTLSLSKSDPGVDTIDHWTISWGDGTQVVSGNPSSVSHIYADGTISYTISATATDEDGTFAAGNTVGVTVNNVAPTLAISGVASVNEGSSYTLNLSNSDPGADTINHWTINWGDGTQVVSGSPSSVSHVYADGSNSYTISATATDEDGTFTAGNTVSVTVNNVAPTLAINGAASINEGSTYTLNLSKSDPGADTINHWTINWGDGTQAVSGSPTSVTHVYADGTISYTISATATDEDGTFAAGNTVAVTVQNVAPTANAGGPYATFDDAPITLTGTGTDPAGTFDPLTFKWDLDGDGIFGETGSGATRGNEVGANVTYNPTGLPTSTQTVKLQVSDGDGGVTVATTTVQILGQGTLAIGGVLYIVGSNTANDIVLITQCNNTITVLATFNSNNPMTFNASSITDIQVRMRGGNDIVVTTSDVTETMTIDGGAGNDLLTGGGARSVIIGGTGNDILYGAAGNDVLLGGDGNDDLFGADGNDVLVGGNGNDILDGGNGRDVLIGSQDEDSLSGGNDEDILIGGYTVHDNNVAALDSIMAIWGSSASFSSRVATLSGSGGLLQAGTKVFDDDDHDQLVGDAGRDLYFGDNNPADHVTDSISLQALQDQLIAVT